jgi:hypothetical protein
VGSVKVVKVSLSVFDRLREMKRPSVEKQPSIPANPRSHRCHLPP